MPLAYTLSVAGPNSSRPSRTCPNESFELEAQFERLLLIKRIEEVLRQSDNGETLTEAEAKGYLSCWRRTPAMPLAEMVIPYTTRFVHEVDEQAGYLAQYSPARAPLFADSILRQFVLR